MSFYKSSKEEFASSYLVARIKKIKWWFILFILFGLLALLVVGLLHGEKATQELRKISTLSSTVVERGQTTNSFDKFIPRVIIMAGIFLILGIAYCASIFKLFFSRNGNQVDKAADLVKTLTGFFVGAATVFLK